MNDFVFHVCLVVYKKAGFNVTCPATLGSRKIAIHCRSSNIEATPHTDTQKKCTNIHADIYCCNALTMIIWIFGIQSSQVQNVINAVNYFNMSLLFNVGKRRPFLHLAGRLVMFWIVDYITLFPLLLTNISGAGGWDCLDTREQPTSPPWQDVGDIQ